MITFKEFVVTIKENTDRAGALNSWHEGSHRDTQNSDGSPEIFYHGTASNITAFTHKHGFVGNDSYGAGHYFTNRPDVASGYASTAAEDNKGGHPNVMHGYLKVKNPIDKDDETPLKRAHIEKMIKSAPNHEETLYNYGDVKHEGYQKVLKSAVDSYAELPKFHAMNCMHHDFYPDHKEEFLSNFTKHTGHDGVITKFTHEDGSVHKVVNIFNGNQFKHKHSVGFNKDPKSGMMESTSCFTNNSLGRKK